MSLINLLIKDEYFRMQAMINLQGAHLFDKIEESYFKLKMKEENKFKTNRSSNLSINSSFSGDQHRWVDFKSVYLFYRWYQYFSTICMIYLVCRNLLPLKLLLKPFGLDNLAHCYFVGRFIITHNTAKPVETSFATLHLLWRAWRKFSPPKDSGLIMFLMSNTDDVKFVYDHIQSGDRLATLSSENRLLKSIISYSIRDNYQAIDKLRFNRSPEALRELRVYFSKVNLIFLTIFTALFWPIFLNVTRWILFDDGYLLAYAGCSPELDQMKANGDIKGLSIYLNLHRVIALLADTFENSCVWFDSGIALTFTLSIVFSFNSDMKIGWRRSQYLLERLIEQLKANRIQFEQEKSRLDQDDIETDNTELINFRLSALQREIKMDRLIFETQMELNDFFRQLQQADYLVSEFLSVGVLVWLSQFALITFLTGESYLETIPLYAIQLVGCTTLTVLSFDMFCFQQKITQSYKQLSSIIAYDRSVYRIKLIRILEFYTVDGKTTFTLFHLKPFIRKTFLNIFGWTLSCFILMRSIAIELLLRKRYKIIVTK